MRLPRLWLLLSALWGPMLGACAAPAEPVAEVLPASDDGKVDNYYSPVGREYDVSGTVSLLLSAEDQALEPAALADRLDALLAQKAEAVTAALDARMWELWPEPRRQTSEGLVITMRQGTPTHSKLTSLGGGAYTFTYRAEVAGSLNLLKQLPLAPGDKLTLSLSDETSTQEITLRFTPLKQTTNAYPRYPELFKDGLEITIHVGGDHLSPRHDLAEARAIYESLRNLGLYSPVPRFEDLRLDSAPLVGRIDVGGRTVAVRVYLFHADMAPADHLERLLDVFKERVKTADVVIYRGHAGLQLDWSGVVLHYDPRIYIPATDFRTLDLPSKYQLFLFDGCETYAGYADQLYAHPLKNELNADVITSVNYALLRRAETVSSFLGAVLARRDETWVPSSYATILQQMNTSQPDSWLSIYGVHGLADNPHLSPLADVNRIGSSCESRSDCPSIDSLCVRLESGNRVCGAACTDDTGCPSGTRCRPVLVSGLSDQQQCLPPR